MCQTQNFTTLALCDFRMALKNKHSSCFMMAIYTIHPGNGLNIYIKKRQNNLHGTFSAYNIFCVFSAFCNHFRKQIQHSGKRHGAYIVRETPYSAGLPDFSCYNTPKCGKVYQMTKHK
jgi:hypothetical protein